MYKWYLPHALIWVLSTLAIACAKETNRSPYDPNLNYGSDGDADGDTDTDTDTDSDSDSDSDTDADADSDADNDTDADTDTDADSDADSDTDTDADTDTDTDTDSDTDTDVDTDTDTDADTEEPIPCPSDPNLASHGGWIGCDPTTDADNPAGIQGGWYIYGDPGGSCATTETECDSTGCRFHGRTLGTEDYDEDWGCGMGLGLNTIPGEAEDGSEDVKNAYVGEATCFDVEIEGSSGGAETRISFTQFTDTDGKVSPFMTIGQVEDGWSGPVCFNLVECPSWEGVDCDMTGEAFDIQFQVAGGEVDGEFDLKITKLIPQLEPSTDGPVEGECPAMAGNGSSCEQYPEALVTAGGKNYYVVGNAWGPGSGDGTQCIEWNGTDFTISSQTASSSQAQPVSYPAAILGTKGNLSTSGSGLPIQVSAMNSIKTGFHTNATSISGTFNASYDIWTNSSPNGGVAEYFVMLWLENKGDKQPAGSATSSVNIEGYQWQVWTGGTGEGGGKYIAYVVQGGTDSIDVDLKPFFDDAVANRGLPASQYIINIQAGFEIWSGGGGLHSECFYADVN